MFGSADVEPDEELELLKQILHANLPRRWTHSDLLCLNTDATFSMNKPFCPPGSSPPELPAEDEDEIAELEEEELASVQVSEREFNFLDFIKR